MFNIYSYFCFHVSQRCMLLYAQIDTSKQIDEAIFQQIFNEAEGLLIGQGKSIDVGNDQFIIINHEDIISGMHVANVYKHDEKDALGLLTKLGKAFKYEFQSEIDEFNPEACDITSTFSSFSGTLVSLLNEFISKMEPKNASKSAKLFPKETPKAVATTESPVGVEEKVESNAPRFPGSIIEPEQLDEVLFHEYEELTNVYNVEMVDGIISRNKIYLYSTSIDVDYSQFPQRPKIKIPSSTANVLETAQKYQNWNAEDPPRILDLISEIEQLLGSYSPSGPSSADRAAEVEEFVENLGYSEVEKETKRDDRKTANITLADRLLSKEKKEGQQKSAKPVNEFLPNQEFDLEEKPVDIALEVTEQADDLAGKTPLKDILKNDKINEEITESELPSIESASLSAPTTAKPVKFVIKPKFIVDGEEVRPEPTKLVSKAANQVVNDTKSKSTSRTILNAITTPTRSGPSTVKKFEIPAFHELDSFVPTTSVKKPELKAPAVPSRQSAKPVQKPAKQAAAVKPSPVEIKSTPQTKPRTKPKDDDVMPGWGDGGGEIEMRKARDIDDFDIPIKKIDSKKNDSPEDEERDDSS